MKAIAIIPARLASTRLPRKILREICGRPMLTHVYEAARAFTGWTVENGEEDDEGAKRPVTGKFMLREAWHDPYQKRVLAAEFDPQRPALRCDHRYTRAAVAVRAVLQPDR